MSLRFVDTSTLRRNVAKEIDDYISGEVAFDDTPYDIWRDNRLCDEAEGISFNGLEFDW